jgi:hypothetical protein
MCGRLALRSSITWLWLLWSTAECSACMGGSLPVWKASTRSSRSTESEKSPRKVYSVICSGQILMISQDGLILIEEQVTCMARRLLIHSVI